jgi:hypothetical protein
MYFGGTGFSITEVVYRQIMSLLLRTYATQRGCNILRKS